MTARLSAKGIVKSFGPTRALRGVDLDADAGSIVAIIGQNGAGKSTLMSILAGTLAPDMGTLTLEGKPYCPSSPLDAQKAGVAMVHQELSLCPHLSAAENVLLGALPGPFGMVDWDATRRRASEVLSTLTGRGAAEIDPDARVSDLSPASQQIVEIARALAGESCRVLILDEPTSSLAAADVERLMARLRLLKERGLTILYLSHFLEEVKMIADRFVVLRDGSTVGEGDVASASIDSLVELMAGRPIENLYPRSERKKGETVLEVTELAGEKLPKRCTLSLARGEVVGIAGLLGAGRTELFRAIFGLDRIKSGSIKVKTHIGPRSPAQRLDEGVGMLSEDRKGEGLATALSIADNMTLSKLGGFFVSAASQQKEAERWIERLGIAARDPAQAAMELSGGNQQKIAVARLFHHGADVLLLDEPTRGIDVNAKAQIYALIDAEAAAGKAVLLISSYLPELLGVCDRIHVMQKGVLGPSHLASEVDEHALLKEATVA